MKRRRNSTAERRRIEAEKGEREVSDVQINCSGPSLTDLPDSILVNILLRLSIKRIFVCKCVCKAWGGLISDPDFAKLHFNQAQVYPLLRAVRSTCLSRMLYLVQPDDFDMCFDSSPIKIELDTKMKLPLRNIGMILDIEGVKNMNGIKLAMKDHRYGVVNSCNGLLCLSNPSDNEPVIVCNPITGEFINLPEVRKVKNYPKRPITRCGFGFSPATNQYKVIRMFSHNNVTVVEVHVLGSETWRALRFLPQSTSASFPTYLDGCVYWFSRDARSVISFDIEKECFESISVPLSLLPSNQSQMEDMGVLGGELFICASRFHDLRFWAMKDNGASKSWSQVFSFLVDGNERLPYGSYKPIKYLNNGALLMFLSYEDVFICKDPRKTGFRYLKIRGFRSEIQAIAHIPSFVPLKHALSLDSGHNVKVLNVKSRCAELKLYKEAQGISIIEERRKTEPDSDPDADANPSSDSDSDSYI